MAEVIKVIEVLAESPKSWEGAAQEALKKASKTIKSIRSIYIKELEAKVDRNKIIQYRINAKISFLLE
jgi:dodecin